MVFALLATAAVSLGLFQEHSDIGNRPAGKPDLKGSARCDSPCTHYELNAPAALGSSGSSDSLHLLYTRKTGDFILSSEVSVTHGWVALMIRQSLDPDSPYAAVVLDATGQPYLRYRPGAGVAASDFRVAWYKPAFLSIDRRGNEITVHAGDGKKPGATNGPIIVSMTGNLYVGIAVGGTAQDAGEATAKSVQFSR